MEAIRHTVDTKRSLLLNTADGTYLLAGFMKAVLASGTLYLLPLLSSAVRFRCLEQGKFTPFCRWHLENQGTVEEIVVGRRFWFCVLAECQKPTGRWYSVPDARAGSCQKIPSAVF